ncbi:hypothetical protein HZC32_02895 [Candidatus Woesearchaeota archaeon]|nr:hypothetical protein [Candidatus Woesearchaeota archaeon]
MKTLIFILPTLLLFSLVYAQSGCFVYPDSSLYCQDITPEEAEQECSIDQDCDLNQAFFTDQSCSNIQSFPNCEMILCKSSCTDELAGKCVAGKVPDGDEEQWCSLGCCRFSYSGGEYCGFKNTKWLCEIEAKNKEATKFSFSFSLEESECTQKCSEKIIDTSQLEEVSSTIGVTKPALTPPPTEEKSPAAKEVTPELSPEATTSETNLTLLWIILTIAIVSGAGYYWLIKKRTPYTKPITQASEEWGEHKEEPVHPFSMGFRLRSKLGIKKWQHKVKHKQRQEFLSEAHLVPEKTPETPFSRLKKIAWGYDWCVL